MRYRQSSYIGAMQELRILCYDAYDLQPAHEILYKSKYTLDKSYQT